MKVFSAGLPVSAINILSDALNTALGQEVEVVELKETELRSKVRLSNMVAEVVLVVLDEKSAEACSSIENGLYSSDKYHAYTTDNSLIDFLNSKYNLNIPYLDVTSQEEEIEDKDIEVVNLKQQYEEQLRIKDALIADLETRVANYISTDKHNKAMAFKNSIIANLEQRLLDLSGFYGDVVNADELADKENEIKSLKFEIQGYKDKFNNLQSDYNKLLSKYDGLHEDIGKLKIDNSNKAGVLLDREHKITELNATIKELKEKVASVETLNSAISEYQESLVEKDAELVSLRVEIKSKDSKIASYETKLEDLEAKYDTDLEDIKKEKSSLDSKCEELEKRVEYLAEFESKVDSLEAENAELKGKSEGVDEKLQELEKLRAENNKLKEDLKESNNNIAILNKVKIDLTRELSVLKGVSNLGGSNQDYLNEIQDLNDELHRVTSSIFSRIGSNILPTSKIYEKINSNLGRLNNVRFVFAGSSESRKGAYRCLHQEFSKNKTKKYLLVDLVSETYVDYVFNIKNVKSSLNWFEDGGDLRPYIRSSSLPNTGLLLPELKYTNDGYFLCIDWEERLRELEASGYNVVIFCGDISNLVGRVLFESFVGLADTSIYVSGTSSGARNIVSNIGGLENIGRASVYYFDFNPKVKKFFDMVNKVCQCEILSFKESSRR